MKHIDTIFYMNIFDLNTSNIWWMPQQNNFISILNKCQETNHASTTILADFEKVSLYFCIFLGNCVCN